MNAAEIRIRMTEISAAVSMARNLLADGKPADMSHIEERVETLCRDLLTLPQDDREEVKPGLVALMDELGLLAETVRAQHAALVEQLSTVVRGQRAVGAYAAPVKASRRPKR